MAPTDAVNLRSLARTARVVTAGAGLSLTALSGLLARLVVRTVNGGAALHDVLPLALVATVLLATGLQALHVALTGRLRGRLNRFLSAIRDSFGNIQVP